MELRHSPATEHTRPVSTVVADKAASRPWTPAERPQDPGRRRRRRRQVPAWRSGWAPGRVLRGRPCLTRAERTKRSGPVCARGSSRGGSGGPGAWLWPSIWWSRSSESAMPDSAPPAAALTWAHLRLTRRRRRRPERPIQVRTWPAPPFLATLHLTGPCTRPGACADAPAQRALIRPVRSRP